MGPETAVGGGQGHGGGWDCSGKVGRGESGWVQQSPGETSFGGVGGRRATPAPMMGKPSNHNNSNGRKSIIIMTLITVTMILSSLSCAATKCE